MIVARHRCQYQAWEARVQPLWLCFFKGASEATFEGDYDTMRMDKAAAIFVLGAGQRCTDALGHSRIRAGQACVTSAFLYGSALV